MAETSGLNSDDIRAFSLSGDDAFVRDRFVRVAGESGGEVLPARGNCNARPAEMNFSLDIKLQAEIAVLQALATVRPLIHPVRGSGTLPEVGAMCHQNVRVAEYPAVPDT
jgi:hypothetical protein